MDPSAFKVSERHFEIYDDRFDYADIRGIRWQSFERLRRFYFIPLGVSYTYELTFEFASGQPLTLGVGDGPLPAWASPSLNKSDFAVFAAKVQQVLEATREFRLAPYRDEMRREGFFEYDGKTFFADGSVQYKGQRRPLDLGARAKATGNITELKLASGGAVKVNTAWDRDCFHVMLNETYGAPSNAAS